MPQTLQLLIVAVTATLATALSVPIVKRFAHGVGAVDAPGGRRVHVRVTPRLGGVAIFAGYVGALALALSFAWFPWWRTPHQPAKLALVLSGALLMMLVGAIDDVRALGAKRKLVAQIAAASIAWFGGARIERFDLPLFDPVVLPSAVSFCASVFWVVAFINAINLIDGLDGLAGGVVFFAALTNSVVAWLTSNALAAFLNAALGGAVLGFLFYNFNPASIFMGDAGSMFLGYVLGASALLSGRQKESTLVSLLVPIIALGVPLADTLFAMVRRFLARRPIFSPDRGHIHHRLLDLGLTHRRAVLTLYGASIVLCALAVAAAFGKNWHVGVALLGALATLFGIARFAGYFEVEMLKKAQRAHVLSAPTDALRRALPTLVIETQSAETRAMVWAALERLLDSGWFAHASFTAPGETEPLWRWEPSERTARREGYLVETSFRVRSFPGADEATLTFGVLCDESSLPPHIEVLLQVCADMVEQALVRLATKHPASTLRLVKSSETA